MGNEDQSIGIFGFNDFNCQGGYNVPENSIEILSDTYAINYMYQWGYCYSSPGTSSIKLKMVSPSGNERLADGAIISDKYDDQGLLTYSSDYSSWRSVECGTVMHF